MQNSIVGSSETRMRALRSSAALSFALNAAGVVVFAGLIAYDTQRLKAFHHANRRDAERMSAATDLGALSLYLDFVNFYQMLLALTGGRR